MRRCRGLSGMGGLALACSFFLPMFPVCNDPLIPSQAWVELARDRSTSVVDVCVVFVAFGVPYLFGLLTVLMVLRGRSLRQKTQRSLGISASVLFAIGVTLVTAGALVSWRNNGDLGAGLVVLAVVASLAYYLRSLRMGPGGLLCLRWYFALCCTVWFAVWFFSEQALSGLKLSLAGALAVLAGTTAEALVRCRLSPAATLWALLCCRLQLYDLEGPRCLGCGYLLLGLKTQRCPECGRSFQWADYHDADRQPAVGPMPPPPLKPSSTGSRSRA